MLLPLLIAFYCLLFIGTSLVAQMVKCLPTMQETQVQSLGWEDLLEKEWQPTPVLLPGKSHGLKSLISKLFLDILWSRKISYKGS